MFLEVLTIFAVEKLSRRHIQQVMCEDWRMTCVRIFKIVIHLVYMWSIYFVIVKIITNVVKINLADMNVILCIIKRVVLCKVVLYLNCTIEGVARVLPKENCYRRRTVFAAVYSRLECIANDWGELCFWKDHKKTLFANLL